MIKEKRLKLGLTQIQMAKLCGVSLMTYQLWEKEVGKPNEQNKIKLAEVLNIPIEKL